MTTRTMPVPAAPRLRRRLGRRLGRRLAAGVALSAALVFGVGQAILPSLAARRLKSSLERNARGVSVSIAAFPAVGLLFGRADRVTVHIRQMLPAGHGSLVGLLDRVSHAERLDATVGELVSEGLRLERISLAKRGAWLAVSASVTPQAIREDLPADIQFLGSSSDGRQLEMRITASIFGHSISAGARVAVRDGTLQISPAAAYLAAIHITVFSDPQVAIDSISMHDSGDRYWFHATGHYT